MAEVTGLRVLIVDDDPDHRYLMARRLRSAGHVPTTTSDPRQVLDEMAGSDLIVLDYRIPGASGIDVLGEIVRRHGPPVVMVTGMGSEAVAVEALQAGAVDYVVKTGAYLDDLPGIVTAAWRRHDTMRRSGALQSMAMLVTGMTDPAQVIEGITTGAKRLLDADRVELTLGTARRTPAPDHADEPLTLLEVPIVASTGEELGTVIVHNATPRAYSPADLELLESFAAFAAIGLSNAKELQVEREAVGELKDTLDLRRQLIAAVGHELRTPLTAIAGFSATLLRHWDNFTDAERRELVERIDKNSGDLTEIVTRLMDFAYIDSGRMDPQLDDVDLHELTTETVEALSAPLSSATVHIDVGGVSVRADRTLLRRVLVNLLTNAEKYGGDHPTIQVRATAEGGAARIAVNDNGPGIDPADVGQVFEAFYRSARDRRKRQGTGIGLALVQDYVRVMGGEVGVESSPGAGATFWFTLPLVGRA